ncbi:MAG: flagellar M-ring protein FliF [Candidatus Thiodiazotropha lotti]|uniref:Flagellar M-ring protein n=1 Tax=Candidatus Thiodiazotropha endoloripes TaxID=1818881 RepID=A0A1E2UTK1_9GAMM|nr:flagellar basal-body MS-ring/collar protein FliF [Candidatus Thiodiazotropha endoloripes]MCG7903077.1 flagellar M-ring protein FliF [Candidatus Thiodiazotropha weberae]MCG7990933.1 flagellar M-ring protein FliF [Candidatus Thiodiazotropha lotti]MCG7914621.1 flagellar M-ring protein FliF [Candidatus Thiodiazotropha weberae]MCG8001157.1 flagellar M-ring protein FliF [Candidatus Thiodiazotropha lotti]MCW4182587.1 flagellar basal-body MS-ring/collar protein FliF [Candidatus Thiodiazotropha webe
MATVTPEQAANEVEVARIQDNPIVRQIAVMVGIAASVALGVAVVLWTQKPSYAPLFGNLPNKDAMEISQALQQAGIDYEIDQANGIVMVPSSSLQEARMKLAGQGLPRSGSTGFELMQEDTGFSTSKLVETARYQRAIEGELARSIMTMANVDSARVHLATPKQSVFIRKRKFPSASVVVKLYPGRSLEKGQVEAITHLVASSVPELDVSNVTVVDQKGRLLSTKKDSREMQLTSRQFEYTRELEGHYKQRIEDILEPVVGRENLRAEVTADMDFTYVEQTQEYYNPDVNALRSEQINEQQSVLSDVQGVPGALTNQPPAAANAPQVAGGAEGEAGGTPVNTSKRATRNFELDKTISHTRLPSSRLRKLSVAVVVNDRYQAGEDGVAVPVERTAEEITRISNLVKEAVGFDVQRGDRVQVISEAFYIPQPMEPLPEVPMWEQSWFWDLIRQVGGALLFLLLVFGVLKPTMTRLTKQVVTTQMSESMATAGAVAGEGGMAQMPGGAGGGEMGMLSEDDDSLQLPGPRSYEKTLDAARNMIQDDPKRVAQVVKKWIAEDGNK